MINLKKNLQAVNRELKALAKKVDQIVVAVGKLEKAKVTKKPKAKSEKQIHNNVYKLKKQGKVKSIGKGVYLKA